MEYKCEFCNKVYSSYQSLWNHKHRFHIINSTNISQKSANHQPDISQKSASHQPGLSIIHLEQNSIKKLYQCKYCDSKYKHVQSKFKHEKKCKEKEKKIKEENEKKIYMNEIQKLKSEIDKLKNKSITKNKIININSHNTNTNSNNVNSNNSLNICNPGDENVNSLTNNEKKMIMAEGMNSIVSLVEQLNFNERLPENHNFFTSAINDKYVNTYDKKNNKINKQSKTDLFDKILFTHMNKLETLSKSSQTFSDVFDKLKSFIYLKKGRRQFFIQLNMLSYNKRNMVIETINKLIVDETITPEEIPIKIEEEVKQIAQKPEEECQIEELDDSDIESDSETEDSNNDDSDDDDSDYDSDDEDLPALFRGNKIMRK
jgi:hypothetical protein